MTNPIEEPATKALERFTKMTEAERHHLGGDESANQWLFIDRRLKQGRLLDMNFYGFDGKEHVFKFFEWITGPEYPDYFDDALRGGLAELSAKNDAKVFQRLGVPVRPRMLDSVGRYNAQDYLYQRMYPVPDRQKIRRILDFGAGHGRMANLAFSAEGSDVELMVSLDSIPGSYLTQRLYYNCLDRKVFDYLDNQENEIFSDRLYTDNDIVHLPTWHIERLPDNFFDMVCCVQVLREIPQQLFLYIIQQFQRILRPGGALYIRDSNEMHNPNLMPQELIVSASGFVLEFYPRITNLQEVHGIPRIWRKLEPSNYLTTA